MIGDCATRGTGSLQDRQPKATLNQIRAFADFTQRINVAQQAADATKVELNDLMSRLGIQRNYGLACETEPNCEPSGEVQAVTQEIEQLTDSVRELRGLAETLNASL
jgi:hypothetical protein